MLRTAFIAALALALVSGLAAAEPPRLPAGVTCEAVKAKVAEHGKVYAYAWARMQGYSAAQISEAKRCLR